MHFMVFTLAVACGCTAPAYVDKGSEYFNIKDPRTYWGKRKILPLRFYLPEDDEKTNRQLPRIGIMRLFKPPLKHIGGSRTHLDTPEISVQGKYDPPPYTSRSWWQERGLPVANSSFEEFTPERNVYSSFRPDNTPRPWEAAPFKQMQINIDQGVFDLSRHLEPEALLNKGTTFYVVIVHVITSFSLYVAQHGWYPFDTNYDRLARLYMKEAFAKPRDAIAEIQCHIKNAEEQSQEISQIIKSDVLQFVCEAQAISCDTVIHAIIMQSKGKLDHATDVFLTRGNLATTFLNTYSQVIDTVSRIGHEVAQWILEQRVFFRPLVEKLAALMRKLYPNGAQSCARTTTPLPSREDVF